MIKKFIIKRCQKKISALKPKVDIYLNSELPTPSLKEAASLAFLVSKVNSQEEAVINQLEKFSIVTGNDLLNPPFNLPSGPLLGKILNDVKKKYIEKELLNREDALEYIRDTYIKKESLHFFLEKNK